MHRRQFAAALAHHEAGRLDAARAGYRETLARDPNHPESLHLMGLILVQTGDPAAGAALIGRAIELAPAGHRTTTALLWHIVGCAVMRTLCGSTAPPPRCDQARRKSTTTSRPPCARWAGPARRWRNIALAAAFAPEIAEIWYNLASTLAEHGPAAEVEHASGAPLVSGGTTSTRSPITDAG